MKERRLLSLSAVRNELQCWQICPAGPLKHLCKRLFPFLSLLHSPTIYNNMSFHPPVRHHKSLPLFSQSKPDDLAGSGECLTFWTWIYWIRSCALSILTLKLFACLLSMSFLPFPVKVSSRILSNTSHKSSDSRPYEVTDVNLRPYLFWYIHCAYWN